MKKGTFLGALLLALTCGVAHAQDTQNQADLKGWGGSQCKILAHCGKHIR